MSLRAMNCPAFSFSMSAALSFELTGPAHAALAKNATANTAAANHTP
jgi:hypothetical protein